MQELFSVRSADSVRDLMTEAKLWPVRGTGPTICTMAICQAVRGIGPYNPYAINSSQSLFSLRLIIDTPILSENPFHSLPVNLKKPVLQALIQEAFFYHVFNSRLDIIQAIQGVGVLFIGKSEMLRQFYEVFS